MADVASDSPAGRKERAAEPPGPEAPAQNGGGSPPAGDANRPAKDAAAKGPTALTNGHSKTSPKSDPSPTSTPPANSSSYLGKTFANKEKAGHQGAGFGARPGTAKPAATSAGGAGSGGGTFASKFANSSVNLSSSNPPLSKPGTTGSILSSGPTLSQIAKSNAKKSAPLAGGSSFAALAASNANSSSSTSSKRGLGAAGAKSSTQSRAMPMPISLPSLRKEADRGADKRSDLVKASSKGVWGGAGQASSTSQIAQPLVQPLEKPRADRERERDRDRDRDRTSERDREPREVEPSSSKPEVTSGPKIPFAQVLSNRKQQGSATLAPYNKADHFKKQPSKSELAEEKDPRGGFRVFWDGRLSKEYGYVNCHLA